jgi:hypothetical protein
VQTHKTGRNVTLPVTTNPHSERELCGAGWSALEETWQLLGRLPVVEVPPGAKERFLAAAGLTMPPAGADQ